MAKCTVHRPPVTVTLNLTLAEATRVLVLLNHRDAADPIAIALTGALDA